MPHRLALNRLRTLARRKEDYGREWLPEPLLTTSAVAEDVELAESVTIAMQGYSRHFRGGFRPETDGAGRCGWCTSMLYNLHGDNGSTSASGQANTT